MITPAVPRIQPLPPALANQIAAGEVVERPASVLKELVENSLDAGARRIEIESEAGGIGLIRVRDDGCGIHHEDLPLAISSRATSKIYQEEELLAITTLGFRGEALASVGAVSRLSLSSRIIGAEHGWCIQEDRSVQPIAHPVGTTVEVRDLFYNTPARRRFLRGEKTEFIHLRTTLERLALSHFEVSFRVSYNGRSILILSPHDRPAEQLKRVVEIYGRSFSENSLYFEREMDELRLWGWLGRPEFSRSQTNLQYFYTNYRMVRDRLLKHAARQAYGNRIPQGRHPVYLLYLELPASQVDVNAHPTKNEVRFRQARQVHGFIVRTLTEVLKQAELQGQFWLSSIPNSQLKAYSNHRGQPAKVVDTVAESPENYNAKLPRKHEPLPKREGNGTSPLGQARALVLERYLLAENRKGLVLVDALTAQAYLTQTRLRLTYATGNIARQPLLIPLTINVSPKQAEWVEQHGPKLLELGLGLYRLGPELLVLREIPTLIKKLNLEGFLQALLPQLTGQKQETLDLTSIGERVISLITQHLTPAISHMSLQEMNTLLRDLENLYQNKSAPESKPPWRELQRSEIETWFS
jgi:DNA mismatch repair protein MutL